MNHAICLPPTVVLLISAIMLSLPGQVSSAVEASQKGTDQTATLRLRFAYDGPPRQPRTITPDRDVEYCGKLPIPDESLLINPANQGIKNVILYAYTGRNAGMLPRPAGPSKRHRLEFKECRLQPRVVIARAGDSLEVINRDKVGHNVNIQFFNNPPRHVLVPPRGPDVYELRFAEPAVVPIECNIHPWIKGQLLIVDHSFAACSDENGELTLEGLPSGKITFRVFHETLDFKSVSLKGKEEQWPRRRFSVDLQPGMNDLGVVKVRAE